MRFTLNITMLDPAQYIPLARAAEDASFHAVSVADSIFYPKEAIGDYPYHEGREFLEDKPFIEPLIAISAMAASTWFSGVLRAIGSDRVSRHFPHGVASGERNALVHGVIDAAIRFGDDLVEPLRVPFDYVHRRIAGFAIDDDVLDVFVRLG